VENLFDDRDDRRMNADAEYDGWFTRDPAALKLKLDRLSEALVGLNGGKGPDVIAAVEVESVRAAELLRDALNGRLPEGAPRYENVLMKNLDAGRHIAPAIITRLPVQASRTRLLGRQQRILETHIAVGGHELAVITSHWTSRRSDEAGEKRGRYGDQIYGAYKGRYRSNPEVDLLVCGDFNDPPDAPSVVQHLHAVGDRENVLASTADRPLLFNLFAGKDPEVFGTHFHRRWYVFDQIVVSPGLLRGPGLVADVESVRTVNTLGRPGDRQQRPWRFGNPNDKFERGYSDHFPVTVRLKVE
jgi:endonuclease/exonuclease/phosphatase family metal-dependent hydrolase